MNVSRFIQLFGIALFAGGIYFLQQQPEVATILTSIATLLLCVYCFMKLKQQESLLFFKISYLSFFMLVLLSGVAALVAIPALGAGLQLLLIGHYLLLVFLVFYTKKPAREKGVYGIAIEHFLFSLPAIAVLHQF